MQTLRVSVKCWVGIFGIAPESRVPTDPGKPGKMTSFSSPGKVLEFYNYIKNRGKWE